MYLREGKQREMGLGSASKGGVSLGTARTWAADARSILVAGGDPMAAKKEAALKAAIASALTFGKFADDYIAVMKPSWRNAKHAAQWSYTLKLFWIAQHSQVSALQSNSPPPRIGMTICGVFGRASTVARRASVW